MSFKCTCDNGNVSTVDNCDSCAIQCFGTQGYTCEDIKEQQMLLGITYTVFIIFVIIQILLWIFMIFFTVTVLKKCNGKIPWLAPVCITLLVLWICIGWFPGVGLVLFIALLVILLVFEGKCKKRGKKKIIK